MATTIRQLAVELVRQTGAVIPPPDRAFWTEVSFTAAAEALPPEAERPDVVVVDEGQDFEASDWLLVEQLAGARGLWVFRDERQAFWRERVLPPAVQATLGAKLALTRSYRCPESLGAFAECFATGQLPTRLPPVDELRLVACEAPRTVERVRHLVDELRAKGARPGDIAVVSLSGQTRSELHGLAVLGSQRLVHADAPDAGAHVVVETFLRFKGLERPFVIVCEAAGPHLTRFSTRLHIALTRATVQATLVADAATIAAEPRLQALSARAAPGV